MLHGWSSRNTRVTWIKGTHSQRQRRKHGAFNRFRRILKALRGERRFYYENEQRAFNQWFNQQRASQNLVDRY